MQYPPNPPNSPYGPPSGQPAYPPGSPNPSGLYGQPLSEPQLPSSPTAPARRTHWLRAVLIIGLIAVILVLLGGGAFLHYTGPARTSQAFIEDFLVHYDGKGAYDQLCSDAQAKTPVSRFEQVATQAKALGAVWDLSRVTYSLVDEEFFGTAHVRVGGSATVTAAGQTQTVNFTQSTSQTFTLRSIGLGWCLTDNNFNLTGAVGASAMG
ncbi:MAG: hypothetical protein ACM3N4_09750 [Nitrososphaerota archaeon]